MGLLELLLSVVAFLVVVVISILIVSGQIVLSVGNCIITELFKKPKKEPSPQKQEQKLSPQKQEQESSPQKQEQESSPKASPPVDIDKELAKIDEMEGRKFEHYVAQLLSHQGFHTEVTPGSGDLGVDIVASNSSIKYAIQVKRQTDKVSRHAVSDVVGGRDHYGCNATMVVTNAYFRDGAQELAKSNNCRLVDRAELRKWVIDFLKERVSA
jgi:HJR/Mrr/RecB family endonuclease